MSTDRTMVHLRLDENDAEVMPSDAIGSLNDLLPSGATPVVVDAFTGRGRQLTGGAVAFVGQDAVVGGSLATRDVTVQAIVSWNFAVAGVLGNVVARGKGNSAAEYVSYGVELRQVNSPLNIGELRFWWQDTAGNVKKQTGGQFVAPTFGQYMFLTATRHWVSSSRVEIAYYVGDKLLAEVVSTDGDIGGGVSGTFALGGYYAAGVVQDDFNGIIDEVRVTNYAMSAEEIGATWLRLSVLQPRGYRAVRDLMPPGAPISDDPASRVQKLLRTIGHALGYSAAQIENARQNLLPDRAYGATLEQWEGILKEAPKALDSIAQRRARNVAHLRQHAGVSVPGVQATLTELLQLSKSQIQVLSYSATILDNMEKPLPSRWLQRDPAQWVFTGGSGLVTNFAAGDDVRHDVGANGLAATIMAIDKTEGLIFQGQRATATVLPAGSEVGILMWDFVSNHFLFFGVENNAGTYRLVYQAYEGGVAISAKNVVATIGNVAVYLRFLFSTGPVVVTQASHTLVSLLYSTTSPTAGFASAVANYEVPSSYQWAGYYVRSTNATLGAGVAQTFNDTRVRIAKGKRAYKWYAFRDPALPGSPDMLAATAALRRLKHAHTYAAAITSLETRCDDPTTGCDVGPLGGY